MPSAFHPPRGMLEFWVDPQSPHHNPVFNLPGTRYLLFCAGGWRSALVALTTQPMGVENVVHRWWLRRLQEGRRAGGATSGGPPDRLRSAPTVLSAPRFIRASPGGFALIR